jgi:hypothetical protein
MRRTFLNLLVGALIIVGQADAFTQQTSQSVGDYHGREFVYPYSKLSEGQRGLYVFPRRTKLGRHVVSKGTRVVAEVARGRKGKLALYTVEPIVTRSGIIPEGARISFH